MCHENELIIHIIHTLGWELSREGGRGAEWRSSQDLRQIGSFSKCPQKGPRDLLRGRRWEVSPESQRCRWSRVCVGGGRGDPSPRASVSASRFLCAASKVQPAGRGEETGSHAVPASQESHKAGEEASGLIKLECGPTLVAPPEEGRRPRGTSHSGCRSPGTRGAALPGEASEGAARHDAAPAGRCP